MTPKDVDRMTIHGRPEQAAAPLAGLPRAGDAAFEALLSDRARKLAERAAPARGPGETVQVLVVRMGAERYGLDLTKVTGILPFGQCAPIAGAPDEVLGLINARGEIWAAIEFARLMGMASAETPTSGHIVLLRHRRRRVGLRVDKVDRIRDLVLADLKAAGGAASQGVVELMMGVTSDAVIVIDLDALWTHPAIGEAT